MSNPINPLDAVTHIIAGAIAEAEAEPCASEEERQARIQAAMSAAMMEELSNPKVQAALQAWHDAPRPAEGEASPITPPDGGAL